MKLILFCFCERRAASFPSIQYPRTLVNLVYPQHYFLSLSDHPVPCIAQISNVGILAVLLNFTLPFLMNFSECMYDLFHEI